MRDLAARLAEALKPAPPSSHVPPAAEAAALALLQEQIRFRAARRRQLRVAFALVAAMILGGVVTWGLLRPLPGGIEVESAHLALLTAGATSVAASEGAHVRPGERIETTAGGSAELRFESGSLMWLDEHGSLEVLSSGEDQHVRLSSGQVRSQVTRLSAGQRFRITTPDAEVEVRGTRFTVGWRGTPACAGQSASWVRVEEGVVRVRHAEQEVVLTAGAQWPGPCAPVGVAPAPLPAPAPLVAPAPGPRATAALPSRLAEENRRFSEVLQARQSGDTARALELLERLQREFPHGQLEEDMAAERMRLSAGGAEGSAQEAARDYLRRFPRGYARALAEELLGQTP